MRDLSRIFRYDPDQPRDDKGMWTAGGGRRRDRERAITGKEKIPVGRKVWNNVREVAGAIHDTIRDLSDAISYGTWEENMDKAKQGTAKKADLSRLFKRDVRNAPRHENGRFAEGKSDRGFQPGMDRGYLYIPHNG